MLGRLSYRNARRSIRDYSIYFLTVSIAFALIYTFNRIAFSDDILELGQLMKGFSMAIWMVTCLIIFVIGWLVHYMNRFIIQKRAKELGTYMLLGVDGTSISKMIWIENMLLGGICLLAGILVGTVLYQIITVIIMKFFEAPYQIKLSFSIEALLLTMLYVFGIYLFSLFRMSRKLKKMKLYDLLYMEKKNEEALIKGQKNNWILMLFSVISGILGCILFYLLFKNMEEMEMKYLAIAFAAIIFSIYGFSISLSSVLIQFFIKNKKRKYKKDNLFLFRNLSAKMGTMSATLGTLSVLLLLTLAAVENGMLFKGYFEKSNEINAPVEISIILEKDDDFSTYQEYIHKNFTVISELIYPRYQIGNPQIKEIMKEKKMESWKEIENVMRYSDYQKLRELKGYSKIEMGSSGYFIHGMEGVKNAFQEKDMPEIKVGKETFQCEKIISDPLPMEYDYYFLVLPDEAAEQLEIDTYSMAVETVEKSTRKNLEDLMECKRQKTGIPDTVSNIAGITLRGVIIEENKTTFTIFSFCLFYIGIIFICVAATILAVQILSDAQKYQYRYHILSYLGLRENRIHEIIFKQVLVYFIFPIVLPIPLSIFTTYSVNLMMQSYVGNDLMLFSITGALALFLLVYFLYFIITYITYHKNIEESFLIQRKK